MDLTFKSFQTPDLHSVSTTAMKVGQVVVQPAAVKLVNLSLGDTGSWSYELSGPSNFRIHGILMEKLWNSPEITEYEWTHIFHDIFPLSKRNHMVINTWDHKVSPPSDVCSFI